MNMLTQVRFLTEYVLFRICWLILAKLPQRAGNAMGRALGRAAFALDLRHRKIALANLQMALGDQRSEAEIRQLALSSFQHLVSAFVDLCRYQRLQEEPIDNLVRFEGVERAAKVRAEGRGMILITGHLGSWELGALAGPLIGYPLELLFRPLDNPFLDHWLARVRSSTGNRVVPKKNALRQILSSLQKGGIVVVLIDLNTMRGEGVFVDFFGKPACTTYAPALLALRTGAAVLPILTLRQNEDRLRVMVGEEVPLSRSGDLQRDLVENTARFTQVLEGYVREHPEQWFWPHERWKTRPKGQGLKRRK